MRSLALRSLVARMAVGVAALPAAALAGPNLLANPGAEDGTLSPWSTGGDAVFTVATAPAILPVVGHTVGATDGNGWFRVDGGPSTEEEAWIEQLVDLAGTDVSCGLTVTYGGDANAASTRRPPALSTNAFYTVFFLDAAGNELAHDGPLTLKGIYAGGVMDQQESPESALAFRRTVAVPPATRAIRFRATHNNSTTHITVASFDDLFLALDGDCGPAPNTPPIARCRDVGPVAADANTCSAGADVDAGSWDPDGDALLCVQEPTGPYRPGTNRVTLRCTDARGASSSCEASVAVVSVAGPRITIAADAAGFSASLWPADHQYRTVPVEACVASVVDGCSGTALGTARMVRVYSDEPEDARGGGDGTTCADAIIDENGGAVRLRAERDGRGDGRVYTITIVATDGAGNTTAAACRVEVRHDAGGARAVDSGDGWCTGAGCEGAYAGSCQPAASIVGKAAAATKF